MRVRTDPLENLSCYVMVHGGIDRHERLLDIEWLKTVVAAARDAAFNGGADPSPEQMEKLRGLLRA